MANKNLAEQILKSLNLCSSDKYNIYLVGSRLWGTNTKTSDWDLVIVSEKPSKSLTSIHKSQFDVKLIDRQEFIEKIHEGSMIEVICYLMNKEDLIQNDFHINSIEIDLDKINLWLNQRQIKDLDKAHKFWLKGNQKSAWKILRHILHSQSIYNYLRDNLHQNQQINLTINDIQNIVQPATLLWQQDWIDLDWTQILTSFNQTLTHLQ